jgi:hypothetical protein
MNLTILDMIKEEKRVIICQNKEIKCHNILQLPDAQGNFNYTFHAFQLTQDQIHSAESNDNDEINDNANLNDMDDSVSNEILYLYLKKHGIKDKNIQWCRFDSKELKTISKLIFTEHESKLFKKRDVIVAELSKKLNMMDIK